MAVLRFNGDYRKFDTLDDMVEYIKAHSCAGTGHIHRIHNLLLAGQKFDVELAGGRATVSHDNGYCNVFQISSQRHMVA